MLDTRFQRWSLHQGIQHVCRECTAGSRTGDTGALEGRSLIGLQVGVHCLTVKTTFAEVVATL